MRLTSKSAPEGFWPYVVVVVSPLVNLTQEQVIHLRRLGISSVSLSNIEENELKYVEKEKFSVVYAHLKH